MKADVRSKMLAARRALSPAQAAQYSERICARILTTVYYQKASCILAYASVNNEVSVEQILRHALANGKEVYLPAVRGRDMQFFRMRSFQELREGAFHIPEPPQTEPFSKNEGLMLVPGVAFTSDCMRIGYGGGYYDRYPAAGCFLLAPAYELQMTDEKLLWEPTDRPVDAVITEKAVYTKNLK